MRVRASMAKTFLQTNFATKKYLKTKKLGHVWVIWMFASLDSLIGAMLLLHLQSNSGSSQRNIHTCFNYFKKVKLGVL